jgi:hypothetical protein
VVARLRLDATDAEIEPSWHRRSSRWQARRLPTPLRIYRKVFWVSLERP